MASRMAGRCFSRSSARSSGNRARSRTRSSLVASPAEDVFHTSWLAVPIEELLRDHDPSGSPVTIELRTGDEPLTITVGDGAVTARPGPAEAPDLVLGGDRSMILRLLVGRWTLAEARSAGVTAEGNAKALFRIQPADADDVRKFMDAAAYSKLIAEA